MTTVYLIRHSEGFKSLKGVCLTSDSLQLINEKSPLSVIGEELAKSVSLNKEFNNLSVVWSSNYVRAMATAKYFAVNNNLKVSIDDRLGERVIGIESWDEMPEDYEKRQMLDEYYKIGFGESQIEVRKRMEDAFCEILDNNINKKIAIVGHSTAISFLLKKWCEIEYKKPYRFNGKEFFDGNWKFCEVFKLVFDDDKKLVKIENLNF